MSELNHELHIPWILALILYQATIKYQFQVSHCSCIYQLQNNLKRHLLTVAKQWSKTRKWREVVAYIPLSIVLFIRVWDELRSSNRYIQGSQRQVSVGEADQLDRGHTLVVLLHLLGDNLQLWGSSMGRDPMPHTHKHHNWSNIRIRVLLCMLIALC